MTNRISRQNSVCSGSWLSMKVLRYRRLPVPRSRGPATSAGLPTPYNLCLSLYLFSFRKVRSNNNDVSALVAWQELCLFPNPAQCQSHQIYWNYPKFYRLFLTKSAFLGGKLWKNWNCAVIFCRGRVLKGEITSPIYWSPTQAVQGDDPIVKK